MKEFKFNACGMNAALKVAKDNGYNVVSTVKKFNEDKINKLLDKGDVIFVESSGSADTKKRPYAVENFAMKGTTTKERLFVVRTTDGDAELGSAKSKPEALKLAKQFVANLKESVYCRVEYKITSGNDLVFNCNYSPSKNTTEGSFTIYSKD